MRRFEFHPVIALLTKSLGLLKQMNQSSHAASSPPVVIGATGGSGTRAVHAVLSAGGFHMGVNLNGAGDAMDFEPWLDQWINPVMAASRGQYWEMATGLDPAISGPAMAAFNAALDHYMTPLAKLPHGTRWGWKNPRTVFLLPLLEAEISGLRFLHVLRDGRDMAFSGNQNQLRKHYASVFGEEPEPGLEAAASARLWATINGWVADFGEAQMGERYRRVRLEDLCREPARYAQEFASWLQVRPDTFRAASDILELPASVGRWQQKPEPELTNVTAAAEAALLRFGYLQR